MSNLLCAPRVQATILCSRDIEIVKRPDIDLESVEVVIAIGLHNQADTLQEALRSALEQSVVATGRGLVLILDDGSTDNWQKVVRSEMRHPKVMVISGRCGSPARTRNALLDFVDEHFPSSQWVARLDADDVLAGQEVVSCLCERGNEAGATYILGSNHLRCDGRLLSWSNIAAPDELNSPCSVLSLIESFVKYGGRRELPSCNLIIRTHSGIRYPDIRGAEDHWLVASLLIFRQDEGIIVPRPVYATYTLHGKESIRNLWTSEWGGQRARLAEAARMWVSALEEGREVLGAGLEGVVWREGGRVCKKFYPWAMDLATVERVDRLVKVCPEIFPGPLSWAREGENWFCSYPEPIATALNVPVSMDKVVSFLLAQARKGCLAANVKRDNLRQTPDGRILNIDIGTDILAFTPSRFLDVAARTYSICVLGNSDGEYSRRPSLERQHEALAKLPGFDAFYSSLIEELYPHVVLKEDTTVWACPRKARQVSLLIKTCPQDWRGIDRQIEHIVTQLSYPRSFARIFVTVDTYVGPYLRQFEEGDLEALLAVLQRLRTQGVVNEVLVAPDTPEVISETYKRWFANAEIKQTHTSSNAPLFPQLWAFDQIKTKYVLQCDADVLVGRRDFHHDYLKEMLDALGADDVLGVGFNIPKRQKGFVSYQAPQGGYVPEIRLGLFDLEKVRSLLPLPNPVIEGRFELMWHRALEAKQRTNGMRCLRGGDSQTFYVHPQNHDKSRVDLAKIRDLIAQGLYPAEQADKWDLVPDAAWSYPARTEHVVFLLKGKDTPLTKVRRCFESLRRQTSQNFGLIVIDDGGSIRTNWQYPLLLADLLKRTTLIRRADRVGYLPNIIEAVEKICSNPETLIVILDLDDALMSDRVVTRLMEACESGADLINGVMFRPDKPFHEYPPNYREPRKVGGGNVWAHLRAFKKSLFEKVPKDYFKFNGKWVDEVTDYALMLPMAELSECPVYLDDLFCYYHQRQPYTKERKLRQVKILQELLAKQPLCCSLVDAEKDERFPKDEVCL